MLIRLYTVVLKPKQTHMVLMNKNNLCAFYNLSFTFIYIHILKVTVI